MADKQVEINSQQNRNGKPVIASLQIKNPGSGGATPPDKKPAK